MRIAIVLAVVLAVAAAQAQAKYKPTHRVSVTGKLVNHWTMDEPDECGAVGERTLDGRVEEPDRNRAQVGVYTAPTPRRPTTARARGACS